MHLPPHPPTLLLPHSPLQQVPNNYETDLIFPIVEKGAQLAGINYHEADAVTRTALKVKRPGGQAGKGGGRGRAAS